MTFSFLINPHAVASLHHSGFEPESRVPLETHRGLPGYRMTPLRVLPALADRLGVGTVLLKDEAERLGLPSFKILGASWATMQAIKATWLPWLPLPLDISTIRTALRDGTSRSLATATDGNHGRGVARMAALLGLGAHILVPEGTAAARVAGIESEGARVEVIAGTYDDAVAVAATLASDTTLVVSDTSWDGYERTPRAVVEGYSTMFYEIDQQCEAAGVPAPDLVVLQAGVGAFAAAGIRHFRRPDRNVRTVVVEPSTANCLMVSAAAGALTAVPGPHASSMAGLNCGLPSPLVWPLLSAGVDTFVAIDDEDAAEAMRELAVQGVVAGESGAASLGGLLALVRRCSVAERDHIGLRPQACVLLINTEGATDPVGYARVVGVGPEEVGRFTSTSS